MKRKTFILLFVFFNTGVFFAQCNLVPNSGFENDINCMNGTDGVGLGYAPPWDSPTNGSPDLFNTCNPINTGTGVPFNGFGFQQPHNGNGYANFISLVPSSIGRREYIQVELDSTLESQGVYCVSFYVNPADSTGLGTNNLGMYFSNTHTFVSGYQYLNFSPQINNTSVITDTANWTEITGTYTAIGGERYIIIGNFFSDSLTDTAGISTSRPWTFHGGYYYIDDVDVHRCSCNNVGVVEVGEDKEINIYPNPTISQFTAHSEGMKIKQIIIMNMLGEEIKTILNTETLDITDLSNGIYIAEIKTEKGIVRKKIIKQ